MRIQGENFTWEGLSFPLESMTEFLLTFKDSKSKSAQKKHINRSIPSLLRLHYIIFKI